MSTIRPTILTPQRVNPESYNVGRFNDSEKGVGEAGAQSASHSLFNIDEFRNNPEKVIGQLLAEGTIGNISITYE